jgi:AraC family transcriptional regulator
MIPRFERKESFTVVGLGKDFIFSQPNTIPALWDDFLRQKHRIEQRLDKAFYGVCYGPKETETFAEKFHYTAAVRVGDDAPVPEGMERIRIAAQEYAVFTHKGRLTKLQTTCDFIWKTWLPQSGVEPADAPDFELYGENEAQCPTDTVEGETKIYVPILR